MVLKGVNYMYKFDLVNGGKWNNYEVRDMHLEVSINLHLLNNKSQIFLSNRHAFSARTTSSTQRVHEIP